MVVVRGVCHRASWDTQKESVSRADVTDGLRRWWCSPSAVQRGEERRTRRAVRAAEHSAGRRRSCILLLPRVVDVDAASALSRDWCSSWISRNRYSPPLFVRSHYRPEEAEGRSGCTCGDSPRVSHLAAGRCQLAAASSTFNLYRLCLPTLCLPRLRSAWTLFNALLPGHSTFLLRSPRLDVRGLSLNLEEVFLRAGLRCFVESTTMADVRANTVQDCWVARGSGKKSAAR